MRIFIMCLIKCSKIIEILILSADTFWVSVVLTSSVPTIIAVRVHFVFFTVIRKNLQWQRITKLNVCLIECSSYFYQLLMFITDIQVVWNILRGWCQGVGSFFTNDGGNRWFASGISNYLTNRWGTIFGNRFSNQSQCLFHVTFFENCICKWWYYNQEHKGKSTQK